MYYLRVENIDLAKWRTVVRCAIPSKYPKWEWPSWENTLALNLAYSPSYLVTLVESAALSGPGVSSFLAEYSNLTDSERGSTM